MKLKLIHNLNEKYQKGFICEIDNIMYSPRQCASGIRVRVINMYKKPTWFDLGWFVSIVDDHSRSIGLSVYSNKKVKNESKR